MLTIKFNKIILYMTLVKNNIAPKYLDLRIAIISLKIKYILLFLDECTKKFIGNIKGFKSNMISSMISILGVARKLSKIFFMVRIFYSYVDPVIMNEHIDKINHTDDMVIKQKYHLSCNYILESISKT